MLPDTSIKLATEAQRHGEMHQEKIKGQRNNIEKRNPFSSLF
jgi:hypothetical protein